MVRRTAACVARRAASESGQALVLAFIVMAALSISIAGVVSFTTGNETQFGRDRQLNRAFHIAEAGLNDGLAVVAKNDPSNGAALSTRYPTSGTYPVSLDGGTGTYYIQKYAATSPQCTTRAGSAPASCWVVIATGLSPDGKILKQLQQAIYWRTVTVPVDDVYGFGLFIDNSNGSCVTTNGTNTLQIDNVWISGDYCPSGNITIEPSSDNLGFIYIGGQYFGRNNSQIGDPTRRYANGDIKGPCYVQGKLNPCDSTANIYTTVNTPGSVGSTLQKPDVATAAAALYNSADWTNPTCTPSGTASPFDNTAGPNQSMGTVTLFSGSSYDCKVVDNNGVTHRLAWNNTTQTLSVQNGVYIDGNANFPGNGTYSIGNFSDGTKSDGTIYVNGVVGGSSNFNICGPGTATANPPYGCPLRWDPNQGNVGLAVVNPLNTSTAVSLTGQGEIDMTFIINQGFADTGSKVIAGPVLADSATISGNGGLAVPGNPPAGAPTDVTTSASWVVQPGSWKETK